MLRRMRGERSLRDLQKQVHLSPSHLSRLESGHRVPHEDDARALDIALGGRGELIAAALMDRAAKKDTNPWQTVELLQRIQRSDAGTVALEQLDRQVYDMCCRYVSDDAATLRSEAQGLLRDVGQLLRHPVGLQTHQELLVQTGWLALLIGCLEYDLGLSGAAENTRVAARTLGNEAGASEIVGWSHEMAAWFALTSNRYAEVVSSARDGQRAAPNHSVALQLIGQEAKALARLGLVAELRDALDRGRALLSTYANTSENTSHHFIIDVAKWPFYSMDACRLAGDDDMAAEYAQLVIDNHTRPDSSIASPMRVSEAQLTLATVAARRGELQAAVHKGMSALTAERKSLPSLLLVAGELEAELHSRFPGEPETAEFSEALRAIG
ncbi:MAG TPA: XRE family transcriptional regulator [Micromonosporaceae bacterium]|nr:XRE family transcriptional regulator [Micromonosporaceae bacterium]HCU48449.1 XRE family transcriptional regulator [Micromonosporaceae bacterium]